MPNTRRLSTYIPILPIRFSGQHFMSSDCTHPLEKRIAQLEAAIQAVLEYAQILRQKHQDFLDQYHATNCLTKVLREGWKLD